MIKDLSIIQWIAEQIIFALSIVLTALLILWRISKQHKNSLELQRKNKVDELHLEIYKDIAQKIEDSMKLLLPISSKIYYSIPSKFSSDRFLKDEFKKIGKEKTLSPTKKRAENIMEEFSRARFKIIDIIFTMEKYEIALDQFTVIRRRIGEELQRLSDIFNEYFSKIVDFLPIDLSEDEEKELGKKILVAEPPSNEVIQEIKKIGNRFMKQEFKLISFIHDLQIEAQNSLLGSLFDRKVSPRMPNDPRYEVLTIYKEVSEDNKRI